MKNYRIIFYLDIDSKDMLDDNKIEYTVKTIDKYQYCVVIKKTDKLYQKINDDNLLSKLLGSEYQEFLAYTYRVY
mgnify:FL=1|tara:strand:+ start:409 stop:633 length:225 start_codon:yes stop_codon:yes gene_type:complete